jgi:RND family efflux transporter MFP subunit
MEAELKSLRIDRNKKRSQEPSPWATGWILGGIALILLLAGGFYAYGMLTRATEVDVTRVRAASAGDATRAGDVILNATGYIVAAHKIELAAKVVGKVAWIGVEKADMVKKDQELVRLEDDEYRAQLQQAKGTLANLQASLTRAINGSRPEEVAKAKADLDNARANEINAKVTLDRTKKLVEEGVLSKQNLDDAQAKFDSNAAQTLSFYRTFDLVRIGSRQEDIDAARGLVEQAKGQVALAETYLANTVIRAPVTGTILERNVEKGEFVTTGFVGDKGAKGYVVSLADLNDLKVEIDINQNDFAKLGPKQKGIVTTDAFPDRKYEGAIDEVSPEANRQKATVQVKVKILHPDQYLRPEMNASVAFVSDAKPVERGAVAKPSIVVPTSAVRSGSVFVIADGRALKRTVKTGATSTLAGGAQAVHIEDGLIGGEDLIVNPPADLKDGDRVKQK